MNMSIKELRDLQRELDNITDRIADLSIGYWDISNRLEKAADGLETDLEEQEEDIALLGDKASAELGRLQELRYYCRVLQDFCRDAGVIVPDFIANGFSRLCEEQYREAASCQSFLFSHASEKEEIPFVSRFTEEKDDLSRVYAE